MFLALGASHSQITWLQKKSHFVYLMLNTTLACLEMSKRRFALLFKSIGTQFGSKCSLWRIIVRMWYPSFTECLMHVCGYQLVAPVASRVYHSLHCIFCSVLLTEAIKTLSPNASSLDFIQFPKNAIKCSPQLPLILFFVLFSIDAVIFWGWYTRWLHPPS